MHYSIAGVTTAFNNLHTSGFSYTVDEFGICFSSLATIGAAAVQHAENRPYIGKLGTM